jgi:hypothetical protein
MARVNLTDNSAMPHPSSTKPARMATPSSAMPREGGSDAPAGSMLRQHSLPVAKIPPGTTVTRG